MPRGSKSQLRENKNNAAMRKASLNRDRRREASRRYSVMQAMPETGLRLVSPQQSIDYAYNPHSRSALLMPRYRIGRVSFFCFSVLLLLNRADAQPMQSAALFSLDTCDIDEQAYSAYAYRDFAQSSLALEQCDAAIGFKAQNTWISSEISASLGVTLYRDGLIAPMVVTGEGSSLDISLAPSKNDIGEVSLAVKEPEYSGLFNVLNQIKSIALAADAQLKEDKQPVKFHQVDAAVAIAVLESLIKYERPDDVTHLLFGEQDHNTFLQLIEFLSAKVNDIKLASDDRTLNAAVFGGPAFKLTDKYFPPETLDEGVVSFSGQLQIVSSFGESLSEGVLVNVLLSLNVESSAAVTHAATHAIQRSPKLKGATIGRLTGTHFLEERHVSFALRVPYTEALQHLVDTINSEGELFGATLGRLKVVVPPDIRTFFSAVSMVDEETVDRFEPIQRKIIEAARAEGNKLPPLHITQANQLIEKNRDKLSTFIGYTNLQQILKAFGLYINVSDGSPYLVCHDHKRKDEVKDGSYNPLPRLGVVDAETGLYQQVDIAYGDVLNYSNDLESLAYLLGNEYLSCESRGVCYHFALEANKRDGYTARTINIVKLSVPNLKDQFFNIEAMGVSKIDGGGYAICYDHRGGINPGEEPWTRCAPYDVPHGTLGDFVETMVENPFAIDNRLNRAISDRAIGERKGKSYFVATIDTEGSDGIDAITDDAYSFIYTPDQCLRYIASEKVEALYVNPAETSAVIATDNDNASKDKICQLSLLNPDSPMRCHPVSSLRSQESFGMSGIAPVTVEIHSDRDTASSRYSLFLAGFGLFRTAVNSDPTRLEPVASATIGKISP